MPRLSALSYFQAETESNPVAAELLNEARRALYVASSLFSSDKHRLISQTVMYVANTSLFTIE